MAHKNVSTPRPNAVPEKPETLRNKLPFQFTKLEQLVNDKPRDVRILADLMDKMLEADKPPNNLSAFSYISESEMETFTSVRDAIEELADLIEPDESPSALLKMISAE